MNDTTNTAQTIDALFASAAITPDMSEAQKNGAISTRILICKAGGMTMEEAIDFVLGAGAYAKMVADLYVALRAKGTASQSI